MQKFIFIFFGFVSPLFSQEWAHQGTDQIQIFFQPRHQGLADQVIRIIENEAPDIQNRLGLPLRSPTKIFIIQSEKTFDELTRHQIPDWGAGVADTKNNLILLKSSSLNDHSRSHELIIHEYIHILMGQSFPDQTLPRWFEEGIAMYLSKPSVDFSMATLVSRALLSKQLIDLNDIEEILRFQVGKAQLAYAESYLAVQFLSQQIPDANFKSFLLLLKSKPDFTSTLKELIQKDLIDFQIDYYRWLRTNYRWFWLVDVEFLLWLSILLVCVAVLFYIKQRNKKILIMWELEEAKFPNPEYQENSDARDIQKN